MERNAGISDRRRLTRSAVYRCLYEARGFCSRQQLARDLELFLDELSIDRERLLGVGIALPAIIDQENRFLRYAPTLSLRDVSLQSLTKHILYHLYSSALCPGTPCPWARPCISSISF